MGFTLSYCAVASMVNEGDEAALLAALRDAGIRFNDGIDTAPFEEEFFDWADDEETGVFVSHPEVGWSWWSKVQNYLVRNLGRDACPTAQGVHAWYGVAVPADIDSFLLGAPQARTPKPASKPTFLQKIGLVKKPDEQMEQQIDQMVLQYGGESTNLHVVSGPRLLKELWAGLEHAGLTDADPMELYENVVDDDDESVARCYLAMSYKFLKKGLELDYLVWWVK